MLHIKRMEVGNVLESKIWRVDAFNAKVEQRCVVHCLLHWAVDSEKFSVVFRWRTFWWSSGVSYIVSFTGPWILKSVDFEKFSVSFCRHQSFQFRWIISFRGRHRKFQKFTFLNFGWWFMAEVVEGWFQTFSLKEGTNLCGEISVMKTFNLWYFMWSGWVGSWKIFSKFKFCPQCAPGADHNFLRKFFLQKF